MSIKEFFIKLFTADSKLSSKRFFGALGWVMCLLAAMYCTITQTQAPEFLDNIIYTSTVLLGVDSVTAIWKKK